MILLVDHLVGAAEIGEMLGDLSRQRVTQLTRQPDFPKPVVRLKMGAVWRTEDVRQWAIKHGRQIVEEVNPDDE